MADPESGGGRGVNDDQASLDFTRSGYADGREPSSNPDTSRAAAEAIAENATTLRASVYRFIRARRYGGATDDEVEQGMGLRHETASSRRRELVLTGHVRWSGEYRDTRRGRKARVWVTV